MSEKQLIDLVNMDRGAMPKEFYRKIEINCYDCQHNPISIPFKPGDKYTFKKCKNSEISWEGTLKWTGRKFIPVEDKGWKFWK